MTDIRNRQSGLGLTKLFLWGVILGLIAVITMKAVPSFITYQAVLKAVKRIGAEAGSQGTIAQIKTSFGKQMEIDNIKTITAEDLDIYKENGQIIISFAFSDKIKLFGPVSLVIDYKGSSKSLE
jgi:hypothetical protein